MALFNSLTFDGVNSLNSGIYITGEAVYNAPQRQVEMITVPGRNGTLAIDQGRFENIEVTYPAGCFADDQSDFASKIMEFRNELASRFGYKRLVDTYHPDEFRLGTYSLGLEVGAVGYHRAGEFDITFDCKPQRFLVSGEETVTIGEWGETETATGDIVEIDNPDGTLGVKSLLVTIDPIQDLNGYDKPWVGGNGKNKLENTASTTTTNGITFTVNSDGTVTANGTATAEAQLTIVLDTSKLNGDLYFVGSNGATESVANAYMWDRTTGARCKKWDGTSASATSFNGTLQQVKVVQGNNVRLTLRVMNGKTVSNHKFIPMIVASSVSDATYEPYSNICPISGRTEADTHRTGKNLAQFRSIDETKSGITWKSDGSSIRAIGTATSESDPFNAWDVTNYQTMLNGEYPAGTYTLSCRGWTPNNTNDRLIAHAKYADESRVVGVYGTRISPTTIGGQPNDKTFTATAPFKLDFWASITSGSTVDFTATIQLELGSTATDYEPYQGTTYTTALGRTVYGGTLDVVSGVLTVDRAMVDLGDLNWRAGTDSIGQFFLAALNGAKATQSTAQIANALCSIYPIAPSNNVVDGSLAIGTGATPNVYVRDTRFSDATSFKTAMNGVQLVYELATPQTYQLTPQQIDLLLGDNNVWSDGRIAIEYGLLPNIIVNPTLFASNPLLVVTGSGTLSIGNQTLTIASGSADQVIYIDCDSQEAWEIVRGGKLSRNDYIQNAGESFPVLNPGVNNIILGTGITRVEIVPRWWRI